MVRLSFCYPFHPSWGIWSFLFSSVIAPLQSLAGRALCPLLYCNRKGKTRTTLFFIVLWFFSHFSLYLGVKLTKVKKTLFWLLLLDSIPDICFSPASPHNCSTFPVLLPYLLPHFWVLPWSFSFPSQSVASTVLPVWKIICVAIVVLYFQQLLCWLLCKEGNKMKSLPAYRHFILSRSKHRQLRS